MCMIYSRWWIAGRKAERAEKRDSCAGYKKKKKNAGLSTPLRLSEAERHPCDKRASSASCNVQSTRHEARPGSRRAL